MKRKRTREKTIACCKVRTKKYQTRKSRAQRLTVTMKVMILRDWLLKRRLKMKMTAKPLTSGCGEVEFLLK